MALWQELCDRIESGTHISRKFGFGDHPVFNEFCDDNTDVKLLQALDALYITELDMARLIAPRVMRGLNFDNADSEYFSRSRMRLDGETKARCIHWANVCYRGTLEEEAFEDVFSDLCE